MNAEQKQALKDKLVELRAEKESINTEVECLVAQKIFLVDRRTDINFIIELLRENIEE